MRRDLAREESGFLELLLPAAPGNVALTRSILRALALHGDFDEQQATEMAVAVSEAYTNVIQHAGTTWVTLRFALEPSGMTIEVEDDGQGFDTAILDQYYDPANEVGRGMHLIRSLMDTVECQSSPMGTIVRMTRSSNSRVQEGMPWKVAARPFRRIGHIRRAIDRYQRDLALMLGKAEPLEADLDDLAIMERYHAADDKDTLVSDRKLRIKTLQATLEILREDIGEEHPG
jgi:serine/threonine-protein kinase RsbW